jgi:hypothetical protein
MIHPIKGLLHHRNVFSRIVNFGMKTVSNIVPRVGHQQLLQTRTKKTHASKFENNALVEALMKELIFEKDSDEFGEIDQEFVDIKNVILKKFTVKDNVGEGAK